MFGSVIMEHRSLYEMIKYLEYGTRLHIGVTFLGKYYNEKLELPFEQTIHSSPVCGEMKLRVGGFQKCFKCRNMAIKKAVNTKESFGGLCINGVYEYTRPVIIDGSVLCIIFIGNILDNGKGTDKLRKKLENKAYLLDSMESDFGIGRCIAAADLVESYIRMLMEKYPKISENMRNEKLIENIKTYVKSNLEFDIDLGAVAQMFHYNERYFGRLFKAETGKAFSDFLNEQRLERAKHLLESTDETVIDISGRVGFNNVTYFNRLFKKAYGVTPLGWRKK